MCDIAANEAIMLTQMCFLQGSGSGLIDMLGEMNATIIMSQERHPLRLY